MKSLTRKRRQQCKAVPSARAYGNRTPQLAVNMCSQPVVRRKKSTRTVHGLLITDCLTFYNWQPGDKLVKNILLKNTDKDPVTVSYTPTTTPSFVTSFPKKMELFMGNVFRIAVNFEPTRKQRYEDVMKFFVKDTIIPVRLFADIPRLSVKIDTKALEFGERPCGVLMTEQLHISNCGERSFNFGWMVKQPFLVEPNQGTVPVGEIITITVTFSPIEVAEYSRTAVLTCNDEEFSTQILVNLHARSRCATYLLYRPPPQRNGLVNLEFGQFALGQTCIKKLAVCNILAVNVPFTLSPHNPLVDDEEPGSNPGNPKEPFFSCPVTSGILRPNCWLDLTMNFEARYICPGIAEHFAFKSGLQDAEMIIRCFAGVEGPSVVCSSEFMDFGVVVLHESSSLTFNLCNQGKSDTSFQFDQSSTGGGIFLVKPSAGRLDAGLVEKITVTFRPLWPLLYRQTLKCLVHLDGVITVDVFGTCHSSLIQPPILSFNNVRSFDHPAMEKLIQAGPRVVKDKLEAGLLCILDEGILQFKGQDSLGDSSFLVEVLPKPSTVKQYQAWFDNTTGSKRPFTFDKTDLIFEYAIVGDTVTKNIPKLFTLRQLNVSHLQLKQCKGEKLASNPVFRFKRCEDCGASLCNKTVYVTSQANEPIVVRWTSDSDGVFKVIPDAVTIAALGSQLFTLTFSPTISNLFFLTTLQCHIMYEYLTSFQLVQAYQIIPPWTTSVRLCGNAATLIKKNYLRPRLTQESAQQCDAPVVKFRLFTEKGESFCTYPVTNHTENTIMFLVEKDANQILKTLPRFSVLHPGESQLMATHLTSWEAKKHLERDVIFTLNDHEKTVQSVTLTAYHDPEMKVQLPGHVFFPDSAVGKTVEQSLDIVNLSLFPIRFQWFMPEVVRGYLNVQRETGLIASNDRETFVFIFKPTEEKQYAVELNLRITAESGVFQNHRLQIRGSGAIGHISFPAENYSFNYECLRKKATYTFTVGNDNGFDVDCQLKADCVTQDGNCTAVDLNKTSETSRDVVFELSGRPATLSLDKFKLAAMTKEKVNITFLPLHTGTTIFRLYSRAIVEPNSGKNEPTRVKCICTIKIKARQPILQIADIAGVGASHVYGKQRLWSLLRVQKLNAALCQPAGKNDILKNVLKYTDGLTPEICCVSEVPVYLGNAVVGEPSTVRLVLQNPGGPPCKWRIITLEDIELKVKEFQPDSSLPKDYRYLQKNRLIDVVPRHGVIQENNSAVVELQCSHTTVGEHISPVLLEIDKGKLILIRLSATTISQDDLGLVICKTYLDFPPTPVSGKFRNTQIMEVWNPSNHDVPFLIGISEQSHSEIADLSAVFRCAMPTGCVPARTFGAIPFTCKPLNLCLSKATATITIPNDRQYSLYLTGSGITTKVFCELAKVPLRQLEPVQDWLMPETKLLEVSTTHLDLACVPLFSINRKVFFAKNLHTGVLRYRWLPPSTVQADTDNITITPAAGELKTGGCVLFTVTHDAQNHCSTFCHTYTLQFVDDRKMTAYTRWLTNWLREVRERCLNFTISKDNPTADKNVAKALDYITKLHELLADPVRVAKKTANFGQLSTPFFELMCMLKVRPDVRVPELMVEPKMHELHLTVAGQTVETDLFQQAYPGELRNFYCRVVPPTHSKVQPEIIPLIAAATSAILGRAIKAVLLENFEKDVEEVLQRVPDLYYADVVKSSQNVSNMSAKNGSGDFAVPKIQDSTNDDSHSSAVTFSNVKNAKTIPQVYAVSPRILIPKQADMTGLLPEEERPKPGNVKEQPNLPADEDPADLFRDATYQSVVREIFHDIFTSVLEESRNYTFDMFDPLKPLVESGLSRNVDAGKTQV